MASRHGELEYSKEILYNHNLEHQNKIWVLARSWFHFLVPLRKSEMHFRSANQEGICIIDGTFRIRRAQTEGLGL